MDSLRIATFNVENLDDTPDSAPTLQERIAVMRPQLLRLRADVLCLQEIHSQKRADGSRSLEALEALLADTPYAAYDLAATDADGSPMAERNLVILSRFPIFAKAEIKHAKVSTPLYRKVTAIPAETEAEEITWERPILHARLDIDGKILHIINLHLRSKLAASINGQKVDRFTFKSASGWAEGAFISAMKRVGQALETRILIDEIFDQEGPDAWIACCGDFNADSNELPVQTILGPVEETGNPEHARRALVACEMNIPESSRFSLLHLGRGEMIDHILISRPLLGGFRHAEIHNESLHDESGAFRTDAKFPESDHAPVVAEIDLAMLRA